MRFIIPGIPFAKQSFRFTKAGIKYQTKDVVARQQLTRQEIIRQLPDGFVPFSGPVVVHELLFVFPPLKGVANYVLKKLEAGETIYKITKPDLTDNLQKGLWDAMEGVVFINDSQICELKLVRKIYGLIPRVEVAIGEM